MTLPFLPPKKKGFGAPYLNDSHDFACEHNLRKSLKETWKNDLHMYCCKVVLTFEALLYVLFDYFSLDIPAVHWVVQLDCPEDANTYIHRAGRTAR